jgi:23S rRNA (pseudouridine1915-N3)-methyltransferase
VHIHIIAVGQKMPAWVYTACDDYIKRLPQEIDLKVKEIALIKRGKNPDIERIKRDECNSIIAAMPKDCDLVALEVTGKKLSTEQLATELNNWMQQGRDIAIVIGGPDGFSSELLARARQKISLSDMTFPHPLVRIVIVEQLYRAWSVLNNHPYHRA